MSRINIEVYDSVGTTRITRLRFSGAQIGSATTETVVTVKNGSATTAAASVLLGAIRADYLIADPAGEDAGTTAELCREMVY